MNLSARDETLSPRQDSALAVVGLALLLLAFTSVIQKASSVVQGFALLSLVLLLLGLGVLLPISVLSVSALSRTVIRQHCQVRWALADVSHQFPHLRLAMMALLLTFDCEYRCHLVGRQFPAGTHRLA
ncbi:MAG: hypothetical protein CM15mP103_08790 [Gammaproteobacteria bacterium]|nr:MAG: hypothetical protein CM15mP103_08790 [Gammaproteobacteria bacterium]